MMDQCASKPEHQRLCSLKYFCVEMLGYKSDVSYYNHMHEPGWPQRVWVAGRPMLVYEECLAFQQGIIAARPPVAAKAKEPRKLPPKKKRKPPGRPISRRKPAPAP